MESSSSRPSEHRRRASTAGRSSSYASTAASRCRSGPASSCARAAQAASELLELTATLRRECPWDQAQTVESIVPHTLEEAYEVAEAAREAGPSPKLIDELGDLLFQTTFLALLCSEQGQGDWEDVVDGVTRKLIRRHPHVFGGRRGRDRRRCACALGGGEGRPGGARGDLPRRARAAARPALRAQDPAPGGLGGLRVRRRCRGARRPRVGGARARRRAGPAAARTRPSDPRTASSRPSSATCSSRLSTSRAASAPTPELAVRDAARRFRERRSSSGPHLLASADGTPFAGLETAAQERYYQRAKALLGAGDGATGAA